jgi:AcrR family transcriptional regulator
MKQEERRKQILDCAKPVFAEKGYYDTQVEDIIKAAKIGKGTVYEYFRNKEDLFLCLLERFVEEWEKEVSPGIIELDLNKPFKHPAVNYVYQIILTTLKFIQSDRDRGKIVLRMGPGLNIEIESYMRRFEGKIIAQIIEGIKLGQKFYHIKPDINNEIMANFLFGAVLRVAYNSFLVETDEGDNPDITGISMEITSNICSGILSINSGKKSE